MKKRKIVSLLALTLVLLTCVCATSCDKLLKVISVGEKDVTDTETEKPTEKETEKATETETQKKPYGKQDPAKATKNGFTISATSIQAEVGNTGRLFVSSSEAGTYTIEWYSTDNTVASMDGDTYRCHKAGTATLTAEVNGTTILECYITVSKKEAEATTAKPADTKPAKPIEKQDPDKATKDDFTISATSIEAWVGQTGRLFVSSETIGWYTIEWYSTNSSVVSMEDDTYRCLRAGSATLTAVVNGKTILECYITVSK